MKDLFDKHITERRRTKDFLKFALGKRQAADPEPVEKLWSQKFNSLSDPLVPRLFRKYNNALSKANS